MTNQYLLLLKDKMPWLLGKSKCNYSKGLDILTVDLTYFSLLARVVDFILLE